MDDWGDFGEVAEYPSGTGGHIKPSRLNLLLDSAVRLPVKRVKIDKRKGTAAHGQGANNIDEQTAVLTTEAKPARQPLASVPDLSGFVLPQAGRPKVRFEEPNAGSGDAAQTAGDIKPPKSRKGGAVASATSTKNGRREDTAGADGKRKAAAAVDEPTHAGKKKKTKADASSAGEAQAKIVHGVQEQPSGQQTAPAGEDAGKKGKKGKGHDREKNVPVSGSGANGKGHQQQQQEQQQPISNKQQQTATLQQQEQQSGKRKQRQTQHKGHEERQGVAAVPAQADNQTQQQPKANKKQKQAVKAAPSQLQPVVQQPAPSPTAKSVASGGSGLLDKMRARLAGGRFRSLNEELYMCTGDDAYKMMQTDPSLFEHYHSGFQQQTAGWPEQPLDMAAKWLKTRPAELVVVDFGCGEGRLAMLVKQKVHSFDLVSAAPHVIACNMASVPLPAACADVAVFSLALMGTDYGLYLQEAARVLRHKGWLWIAEVRSRFSGEPQEGGKANGNAQNKELQPFLRCLGKLGFSVVSLDASSNRMFFVSVLRKLNVPDGSTAKMAWPELKACVYKKR